MFYQLMLSLIFHLQHLPNGNMCKLVDLIRCGLMQTEDLSQLRKLEQFVGKDHIGQMFKWVKI